MLQKKKKINKKNKSNNDDNKNKNTWLLEPYLILTWTRIGFQYNQLEQLDFY